MKCTTEPLLREGHLYQTEIQHVHAQGSTVGLIVVNIINAMVSKPLHAEEIFNEMNNIQKNKYPAIGFEEDFKKPYKKG